jgi:hypothetical protein
LSSEALCAGTSRHCPHQNKNKVLIQVTLQPKRERRGPSKTHRVPQKLQQAVRSTEQRADQGVQKAVQFGEQREDWQVQKAVQDIVSSEAEGLFSEKLDGDTPAEKY